MIESIKLVGNGGVSGFEYVITDNFSVTQIDVPTYARVVRTTDGVYERGAIVVKNEPATYAITLHLAYIEDDETERTAKRRAFSGFMNRVFAHGDGMTLHISSDKITTQDGEHQGYRNVIPDGGSVVTRYVGGDEFQMTFLCADPYVYVGEIGKPATSAPEGNAGFYPVIYLTVNAGSVGLLTEAFTFNVNTQTGIRRGRFAFRDTAASASAREYRIDSYSREIQINIGGKWRKQTTAILTLDSDFPFVQAGEYLASLQPGGNVSNLTSKQIPRWLM